MHWFSFNIGLGFGKGRREAITENPQVIRHSVLLPWHLETRVTSLPDYISGADSVELTDGDIVVGRLCWVFLNRRGQAVCGWESGRVATLCRESMFFNQCQRSSTYVRADFTSTKTHRRNACRQCKQTTPRPRTV